MNLIYINALVLGLASSLHCLGMCGPLAMAVPAKSNKWQSQLNAGLQYIFGKTVTYALLGALIGIIGVSARLIEGMQILSIVGGILIILFAWNHYFSFSFGKTIQQKFLGLSSRSLNLLFKSSLPFKPVFFGFINGFLPCGLVYIALINSLLAGEWFATTLSMVFFGLGTAPVLIATKLIGSKLKFNSNRFMPYVITILGLLIIIRGLNLGIPYLSPKMSIEQKAENKQEVVMSCCKSKTVCEK